MFLSGLALELCEDLALIGSLLAEVTEFEQFLAAFEIVETPLCGHHQGLFELLDDHLEALDLALTDLDLLLDSYIFQALSAGVSFVELDLLLELEFLVLPVEQEGLVGLVQLVLVGNGLLEPLAH